LAEQPRDEVMIHGQIETLQADVELIWRTLKFNTETIRFLDETPTQGMRASTDGCSTATVCTSCSTDGCVMTVYH
jgi:hypothetical protein